MGNSDSAPPIPPGSTVDMSIAEILFTHDTISSEFRDGNGLTETYDDILYKRLDVSRRDISPITVMYHDGKWWVVRGNRRLCLYKHMCKKGYLRTCPVRTEMFDPVLFNRQYTSKNYGVSVKVRGKPNFERTLDSIDAAWARENSSCTIL